MVFNVTGLEKVPPDCSGQVDVPATSLPGSLSSSLLLGEYPGCSWSHHHKWPKGSTGVESTNNFCQSQKKQKKGNHWPSLN